MQVNHIPSIYLDDNKKDGYNYLQPSSFNIILLISIRYPVSCEYP